MIRLAAGDFRERVRSPGFFLTLVLTLYLAYTVAAGYWVLQAGTYTGHPSSAWIGLLTALLTGTLLSWLGFYVARGSHLRDRNGGVGELLAATALPRPAYLLSKSLAAALLLVLVLGVLALGAAVTAAVRTGAPPDLVAIGRVFLLFAVPPVCLAAGAAVLFDATPGLRGGFGNFFYFLAWGALLGLGIQLESPYTDPLGFHAVQASLRQSVAALGGDGDFEGFSLSIAAERPELTVLEIPAVAVDGRFVVSRLAWTVGGILLPLLAWPWTRLVPGDRGGAPNDAGAAAAGEAPPAPTLTRVALRADVASPPGRPRLGPMVAAELRLILRGWPWWWYAGTVALWLAGALTPASGVRTVVVPLTALWGALLWSPLGNRARRYGVEEILAASPRPVLRPLLAAWLAGALAAGVLFAAPLGRWAVTGALQPLAVLLTGCLLLPALAVVLGEVSGVPRTFEAVFVALWYVGPLNRVPALDFLGVTESARPLPWLAVAVTALALALLVRRRRLYHR